MEEAWRHARSTRRMDAGRSGNICRRFLNGSCRLGPRCNYRHEWPVIRSSQICRYFQKGGCWYGDQCRYLHVLRPEVSATVSGRRGSVPTVSSSREAYAPPGRRGSEPALLQAEVASRRLVYASDPHLNTGRLSPHIAEEQSQDADAPLAALWETVQSAEAAQPRVFTGRKQETSPSGRTQDGAAAAASGARGSPEEAEAFLQSKNVTCGICMDKVYEKPEPRDRVFGILPSCSHAFCLQCIMTWRKTRDMGPDVVKCCPQCRVRSAFYVPSKHWLEGNAKEKLIADFKRNFSKKRCSYFTRYGCCPFKADCLYWHDRDACHAALQFYVEEETYDDVDLLHRFLAMMLLPDEDADDEDAAYFWLPLGPV